MAEEGWNPGSRAPEPVPGRAVPVGTQVIPHPTLGCTAQFPASDGGWGGSPQVAKNWGFGCYDLTFLHVTPLRAHLFIPPLSLSGPALCGLMSQLGGVRA